MIILNVSHCHPLLKRVKIIFPKSVHVYVFRLEISCKEDLLLIVYAYSNDNNLNFIRAKDF